MRRDEYFDLFAINCVCTVMIINNRKCILEFGTIKSNGHFTLQLMRVNTMCFITELESMGTNLKVLIKVVLLLNVHKIVYNDNCPGALRPL